MDGREKRRKAGCSLLPSGSLYLFLCATEVRLTCWTNTICRKRVGVGLVTHCLGQVRSCRHLETRKSATGVAEVPKKGRSNFRLFCTLSHSSVVKGRERHRKKSLACTFSPEAGWQHHFLILLDLDTSADVPPPPLTHSRNGHQKPATFCDQHERMAKKTLDREKAPKFRFSESAFFG